MSLYPDYQYILASNSPRRKELLKLMDLKFRVINLDIDETYPPELQKNQITDFLALKKSDAYEFTSDKELIITADTIVWANNQSLEKPKNKEDAENILKELSGHQHEVWTSVVLKTTQFSKLITDCCLVYFDNLSDTEIQYYLNHYTPYDKAGSYGIQDWLGICKIKKINGSFYTVMGLPTHLIYNELIYINSQN